MTDDVLFDDPDEGVLEIVLSSDEEYQGSVGDLTADERRERRKGIVARFLPGVEAGALFAAGVSVVGLTSSGLWDRYTANRDFTAEVRQQLANRTSQSQVLLDYIGRFRDTSHLKAVGSGAFSLTACLLAVLVLSRWRFDKHARWSRSGAQAALCLGLLGLLFAVLMYTDAVLGLPDPHVTFPTTTG